jgi:hypothetical protein
MVLRPAQAIAIAEAYTQGGAFIQAPCGAGKTVTSALIPSLLTLAHPEPPRRPLLVVPSSLVEKTQRDFCALSKQWRLVPVRVTGYQKISVVSGAALLESEEPDLLIFDEAHRIKDPKASVSKRVHRYIHKRRKAGLSLRVVAMSGTMAKRSIKDFWALMYYCRPDMLPLPRGYQEMVCWASAVDERVQENEAVDAGALEVFARGDKDDDRKAAVRKGLQRRIFSVPGIITSSESETDCSLVVKVHAVPAPSVVDEAFQTLREKWETPQGLPLAFAAEVWSHARQLALGFCYALDPPAPQLWVQKKRAYYAAVREILKTNRRDLDTPLQVANEISRAGEKHPAWSVWQEWREIEPTFKPNRVVHWLSDHALQWAAKWGGPGVVWTDLIAFGEVLSSVTGCRYYGESGYSADGEYIEDASPKDLVVASIGANAIGRNLQNLWHRMLLMSILPTGLVWEQCLSRMHRSGQQADEVEADVYAGCIEQFRGVERAKGDSSLHKDLLGAPARLQTCDLVIPAITPTGWAWRSQKR